MYTFELCSGSISQLLCPKSNNYPMSLAWHSGLTSQFWRLFYYRELTWWLQFLSLSLPGLGICCNHAFLALWFSLSPSGNPYTYTYWEALSLGGYPGGSELLWKGIEREEKVPGYCTAILLASCDHSYENHTLIFSIAINEKLVHTRNWKFTMGETSLA